MTGNILKKSIIPLILVVGVAIFVSSRKSNPQAQTENVSGRNPVTVGVQKASQSRSVDGKIKYPGMVAGNQKVDITAKSSGIISRLAFDLGDKISMGKFLARIDDQGISLGAGKSGFDSGQVQQLELAVKIAKDSLNLAKKNYRTTPGIATRIAQDIAKKQYDSAVVALKAALDSRTIIAPISGVITARNVSNGDSVNVGQKIATISRSGQAKIQFYVGRDELLSFSLKSIVEVSDGQKNMEAQIMNISPEADLVTKRFLIEASPASPNDLVVGTVINVSVQIMQSASGENFLILPISAVTIGQNESYIFLAENGLAKKVVVEASEVKGETVQIKADISPDAEIIVEGNKLLKDGDKVLVK